MVYSLPVLMNIISNYYLYHSNVTESIQVWNTPFFQVSKCGRVCVCVCVCVLVCVCVCVYEITSDNNK